MLCSTPASPAGTQQALRGAQLATRNSKVDGNQKIIEPQREGETFQDNQEQFGTLLPRLSACSQHPIHPPQPSRYAREDKTTASRRKGTSVTCLHSDKSKAGKRGLNATAKVMQESWGTGPARPVCSPPQHTGFHLLPGPSARHPRENKTAFNPDGKDLIKPPKCLHVTKAKEGNR